MTRFEQLGGEPTLRATINDFVDRCFDDTMIGFFFKRARVDKARIQKFEYQHAAEFLGADVTYQGRPLHKAHAAHTIAGGQFARRRQILIETLHDHHIAPDIRDAWVTYQESLREQITSMPGSECK